MVASPQRHPAAPPTAPVSTRPANPPIVVPAMYRPPMADARPGLAWATRCAMASAGSAPSARPEIPRRTSSTANDGASGTSSPATAAMTAEMVIARARPIRSATAAQGSTEIASAPVATETASDTVDSVSSHSAPIAGSTACTA